jgi:hypothetical protein
MRIPAVLAISALVLALPAAALAHGSTKPRHGGVLIMVDGETQVEAVPVAEGLDIYVSEEDQPHEATGLEGHVVVKDDPASRTALQPMDANRLRAPGMVPKAGQALVVTLIDRATGLRTFATFQY